jgi:hypothetical protein
MKTLNIEHRLDQVGLKNSVASIAVVLACDAVNAVIDSPWGYSAVLVTASFLTFWLFH